MLCREDQPVGAARKEAVQIRLFTGLSASWYDSSWALQDACRLASSLLFVPEFSSVSPVTRQPRFLGFPIWHIFRPGVVLVLPNPHNQTSSKKKSWFHNCQGTITNQHAKNSLVNLRPPAFSHRIRSQVSKTGLCVSSCAPFQALNVAAYRPGV